MFDSVSSVSSCSCQTCLGNHPCTRRHSFSSVHRFPRNWLVTSRKIRVYYLGLEHWERCILPKNLLSSVYCVAI